VLCNALSRDTPSRQSADTTRAWDATEKYWATFAVGSALTKRHHFLSLQSLLAAIKV
jgi:hypothetical protein